MGREPHLPRSGVKRPSASSPEKSRLMAAVRRSGTRPELTVGLALRKLGFAYRKDVRDLPGAPDFANKRGRWAVFVHGCFWHRHTACRRATVPKANREFWTEKFRRNRQRDAQVVRALRRRGFAIAIVWECECDEDDLAARLSKVLEPRRVDVGQPVDHRSIIVDVGSRGSR